MATKNVIVCDVPVRKQPCNQPATNKVEVKINGKRYGAGDVCDDHAGAVDEALVRLGFQAGAVASTAKRSASTSGGKKPKTMRAASGKQFTAKEARAWLIEQGQLSGSATGLIAKDKLKMYADAH